MPGWQEVGFWQYESPILDELGKGMVAQSEHTVMINNDGVEVLTA